MQRRKNPRQWDRPGMQRALADPANRRPLHFPGVDRNIDFDPDERQHIDRSQNRALNLLLTQEDEYDTIESGETTFPDEEDEDA